MRFNTLFYSDRGGAKILPDFDQEVSNWISRFQWTDHA